jgi:hypothetical protein
MAIVAWMAPALAMVFTDEVNWSPFDFAIFGTLLLAAVASFELLTRHSLQTSYRLAASLAVLAAFVTVWVNLAIGIVGHESQPINLLFFAVLAVGVAGACLARFEASGMGAAMLITAIAQMIAGVIVWASGLGVAQLDILAKFSAGMVVIWAVSAGLFFRAAR